MQGKTLFQLALKVPGVHSNLRLPQEGVPSKAIVVPDGELQGSGQEYGLVDLVL